MVEKIRQWFTPPVFPDNEDKTRSAQLLHALLGDALILLLLGILGTIFLYANKVLVSVMILTLLAGISILYVLLKRGHILSASRLFVGGLWILSSISILLAGRFNTTLASLLLAVTVLAGVLLGRRSAIIFTLLSVVGGLGLATLEGSGYSFIQHFPLPPLASWFTWALTFVLIMTSLNPTIQGLMQSTEELRKSEEKFRTLLDWTYDWELWFSSQERLIYCFPSCEHITGWTPDDFLSNPDLKMQLVHPDDLDAFRRHSELEHDSASGVGKIEYRVIARDGSEHWIEHACHPLFGIDNHYLGRRVSNRDITERKQVENNLFEKEAQLRALNDNIPSGYTYQLDTGVHGEMRRFLYVSAGVEKIFGASVQQVLDDPAYLSERFLEEDNNKVMEIETSALTAMSTFRAESRFKRENDQMGWMLLTSTPRKLANNHTVWDGIALDITERKRMDTALSDSETKFRTIFENSIDAIGVSKMAKHVFVNPAYVALFGYDNSAELIGKPIFDLIAPDSREQVAQNVRRRAKGEPAPTFYEIHGLKKNGMPFDLEVHVSTFELHDEMFTLVVERDITERRQVEEQEHKQRALAEALSNSAAALNSTLEFGDVLNLILDNVGLVVPHDAANIMLLETDKDTVSLVCHKGYVERGVKDGEMEQQFSLMTIPILYEVAHTGQPMVIPDTQANPAWKVFPATQWVRSYLTVPIQISQNTIGFLNLDSETPGFFKPDHAERLEAFANHAAIAIRNASLYEEIHSLAIKDALTNLYNRRYFEEILKDEYSRHSRSGANLSLLMMDVDNFKDFNDTYGHVRGDECLRQVAKAIDGSISRPPDVAARYGGEEFVCLLPETDLDGAANVAEHIRSKVMELSIPHWASSVSQVVTISIGVATTRCDKDGSAVEIVTRADEQLYMAKSNGRNRVEVMNRNAS